ncbi:DUF4355 domain-containing protein [Ezakiella coagulans]|uniref:DUF4355 domain-containing protein n=1 Tax=Ezakiella coagulans TaxID=46507 RepID=UPI00288AFF44|nr:DUF4355 domain-containing protein [Ezakiella coagulans]
MLETTERTEDFKGLELNLQLFADDEEGTSEAQANENVEEKGNEEAEVKTFTEEEVQARIQSESDKRVTEALKTARAKWEKEEAEAKKEAERLQSLSQKEREEELKAKQLKELEETKAELERVYLERDTIDRLAEENVPVQFKDFLMGVDAQSTNENIKAFKKVYEAEVQRGVEERLKGKTPSAAGQKSKMDAWSLLSEKYK